MLKSFCFYSYLLRRFLPLSLEPFSCCYVGEAKINGKIFFEGK